MAKKIRIRRATPWDMTPVAVLLFKGVTEQAEDIWYPRPNVTKGMAHVLCMIDQGFVGVAEEVTDVTDHRLIVAAIGMTVAQFEWSDDWFLQNEWFYVDKDYRATDIAANLLKFVEEWADTQHTPEGGGLPIVIGMLSGLDTDLKDHLMERRGYAYGGGNFIRRSVMPVDERVIDTDEDGPHVQDEEDHDDQHDPELAGTG